MAPLALAVLKIFSHLIATMRIFERRQILSIPVPSQCSIANFALQSYSRLDYKYINIKRQIALI